MVLQGVTVGEDAVVAAGAVVTSDVRSATVVAGVPAGVVRVFEGADERGNPTSCRPVSVEELADDGGCRARVDLVALAGERDQLTRRQRGRHGGGGVTH